MDTSGVQRPWRIPVVSPQPVPTRLDFDSLISGIDTVSIPESLGIDSSFDSSLSTGRNRFSSQRIQGEFSEYESNSIYINHFLFYYYIYIFLIYISPYINNTYILRL
jgi:hypothetical protein